METTVTLPDARSAEDLRELHSWLLQEPELRGCVHLAERPPEPGHLGTVPELVLALVQSGTTASVLTSAVFAWLRYRTSDVDCRIATSNGRSFEFSAKRVQASGLQAEHQLIREVSAALTDDIAAEPGAEDGPKSVS